MARALRSSCSLFYRTQSFLQGNGLPFSAVLNEQEVEQAFEAEGALFGKGKRAVYTAALSLWGLLSQVMAVGDGRTYVAAVERIRILCLVLGIRVPSGDTGAYCRARQDSGKCVGAFDVRGCRQFGKKDSAKVAMV